jgi:hypothetical protein
MDVYAAEACTCEGTLAFVLVLTFERVLATWAHAKKRTGPSDMVATRT